MSWVWLIQCRTLHHNLGSVMPWVMSSLHNEMQNKMKGSCGVWPQNDGKELTKWTNRIPWFCVVNQVDWQMGEQIPCIVWALQMLCRCCAFCVNREHYQADRCWIIGKCTHKESRVGTTIFRHQCTNDSHSHISGPAPTRHFKEDLNADITTLTAHHQCANLQTRESAKFHMHRNEWVASIAQG